METIKKVLRRGWHIRKSKRKNKKYDVFNENNKFVVSFGDTRYEQFHDKLGAFKNLNHSDEKRLKLFKKRFQKLYNDNKNNPYSSILYSWNLLW
jgi:hypothetical protein